LTQIDENTNVKPLKQAVQPRCAADTAGAVGGLGAIYPAKRAGLLVSQHPPTFSLLQLPNAPGAPGVGRTRIAWQLPPAIVLHPPDACQRRS